MDVWDEVVKDEAGRPILEYGKVKLTEPHPILDAFKGFFENNDIKKVCLTHPHFLSSLAATLHYFHTSRCGTITGMIATCCPTWALSVRVSEPIPCTWRGFWMPLGEDARPMPWTT